MQTFKEFLTERESKSRLTSLQIEEAVRLVKENCSGYLKNDVSIYRGINKKIAAGYGKSFNETLGLRVSANSKYNFYTTWFDNNPKWSSYPKRSKSFICANNTATAEDYGTVYVVYPFDTALVAKLPSYDIWYSFEDKGLDDLAFFQHHLGFMVKYLTGSNKPDYSYDELVKLFKEMTIDWLEEVKVDNRVTNRSISTIAATLLRTLDDTSADSVYDVFENVLTPDQVECSRASEASFVKDTKHCEVYIEGEAVFVNLYALPEFLEKLGEINGD